MQIIKPNPTMKEKLETVKTAFEKRYGADNKTRTPEQWRNLVETYGIETVCSSESLKEKEVKKRMRG